MINGLARVMASVPVWVVIAVLSIGLTTNVQAYSLKTSNAKVPSIEEKTQSMQKIDGFFPMYWDDQTGKLWLEIPRFEEEVLYVRGLSAGLGSNDIGLDRGQSGGTRIVSFQRVGPKILMVQPNYTYRSSSEDFEEKRAVEEGFAKSVLFGFDVAAMTDSRVLVDTTEFLIRDAHNVIGRLKQREKVTYRLDPSRSAIYLPNTKSFPKNTEMDVILTYVSEQSSNQIRSVVPTPTAITLRQHHSLVELPGPGYEPRIGDPRSGVGTITYQDYSSPLGEPMTKRLARRHRLEKKDPAAESSEPVEPIIYYLDRGVPEPIRTALLEGAQWWNQAFESAGFRNAFLVRLMPKGADKMDIRYNVINWVHRSTRGWSSGGSVTDPRTGEIIRGQVTLGSLRVRQDYLIGEGLLSPYENGAETPPELKELALARIRQLSAHEVGHTLGFGHNYYASPLGRISVLDYPHPLIKLRPNGSIDMSEAYDIGIGIWDKVSIEWAYQEFLTGTNEKIELDQILSNARNRGMVYLTNQDLQVNPLVHQWANGRDVSVELERLMKVRRSALDRFGEKAIKLEMPLATMEEALVPVYLHHRYQIEAAASGLGGIYHSYALRGDGQTPMRRVPGEEQRRILDTLMKTLNSSELKMPKSVVDNLPPRPSGFRPHREMFPRYTGASFDVISPAVTLAQITVGNVLNSERAARLIEQHALDSELPGLNEVLDKLIDATFEALKQSPYEAEISRAVERVVVESIRNLATKANMPQVRALASFRLQGLMHQLNSQVDTDDISDLAHRHLLAADIQRFLERPEPPFTQPDAPEIPPGAPIGDPGMDWLDALQPFCSEDDASYEYE